MIIELINVSKLERRIQSLENSVSIARKLIEIQDIRLNVQLSRIQELEIINKINGN